MERKSTGLVRKQFSAIPTNFWLRVITAIVLLPFVLYILYAGGILFAVTAAVLVFLGCLEYLSMVSGGKLTLALWVNVATALLLTLSIALQNPALLFGIIGGSILLVAAADYLDRHQGILRDSAGKHRFDAVTMWFLALYMGIFGGCAILLRWDGGGSLWWLMMITGTWGMDIMSYAGGKLYGKRRLAPRLSPGKTVEGAVTGILSSILLTGLFVAYVGAISPLTVLLLVFTPFVALGGDILESVIKRRFGKKDSRVRGLNIFPGHGGVLDRIDSLMLVTLFYFAVLAMSRI